MLNKSIWSGAALVLLKNANSRSWGSAFVSLVCSVNATVWLRLKATWVARLLAHLMVLLTLPAVVQAQFNYTTNNGTITITGYTGSGGAVTIPSTITGLPVTSIGDYAFTYCSNLTSVTIPNGYIGIDAFSGCTSLTNVTMGNGVTSIGDRAFYECTSLTSVSIPNGSIGEGAFMYCTSLTSVTIGNGVTNIGDGAFYCCTNLRGVYFQGNAPNLNWCGFCGDANAVIYYLPGTTGWGPTFGGCPAQSAPGSAGLGLQMQPGHYACLICTGMVGAAYALQGITNLQDTNAWMTLTNVPLASNQFLFIDADSRLLPARYYRLKGTPIVAPQITVQPQSLTNNVGSNVSFAVASTGSAPLYYQWRFNASSLVGQTSTTLNLNAITTNNAGNYYVTVSNLAGAVTSQAALLVVTQEMLAPVSANGLQVSFSIQAGTPPFASAGNSRVSLYTCA